jgi:capsular exopolysaccharide synthesis family protein
LLKPKESEEGGVVLVTSSVKGEGKTTVSMNLALTLAGNSKTIIVGADIRNPQIERFIQAKHSGLTDYLVSRDHDPQRFIFRSGLSDNLDVIVGGSLAPNPNDLLDMVKFDDMILWLRSRYEFIVLDSAPVMLVSDTLHLIENSDVVLYVAKSGFTEKEMVDFAYGFRNENRIDNFAFVLNSVKPENTRYAGTAGYGYYSYTHQEKPKWWKRLGL